MAARAIILETVFMDSAFNKVTTNSRVIPNRIEPAPFDTIKSPTKKTIR